MTTQAKPLTPLEGSIFRRLQLRHGLMTSDQALSAAIRAETTKQHLAQACETALVSMYAQEQQELFELARLREKQENWIRSQQGVKA